MDINVWLLFSFTEILLCLSPGPAVFYVVSQAMSSSYKTSLIANAGIVTGSVIYFVISATGIGALLLTSHTFFQVVKWLGAAYLIWLGVNSLFVKSSQFSTVKAKNKTSDLYKVFQGGLFIELANPKTLIFFVAILPQFLDTSNSLSTQYIIFGLTSITVEWFSLMLYGKLGNKIEQLTRKKDIVHIVDKLTGGILLSIGTSILFLTGPKEHI